MNRKMLKKYLLLIVVCLGMAPAQAGLGSKIKENTKVALAWQHKMSSLYNRAGWEVLAAPFALLGVFTMVSVALGVEKKANDLKLTKSLMRPIIGISYLVGIAACILAVVNTSYDVAGTIKARWDKRKAAKKEALKKAEKPALVEDASSVTQPT